MTAHSSLDPESFQKLLSNAFEVQESGLDPESLAAIVDLQRSIAAGELDVDDAMDFIAIRARNVANAAGIAIGVLKDDQLIYRAGSGSASAYVGLRFMATLCVSANNSGTGEILRVEDAQTDLRIEAAICRQFGAQALLMLPFYRGRTVAGVLEVLFNEAHVFQHREVRNYRLMVALIEEAMSRAARPAPKKVLAEVAVVIAPSFAPAPAQTIQALNSTQSSYLAAEDDSLCPTCGQEMDDDTIAATLRTLGRLTVQKVRQVSIREFRWEAAAAAILIVACTITYRRINNPGAQSSSSPKAAVAVEQPLSSPTAKQVLVNASFKSVDTIPLTNKESRGASRTRMSRRSSNDVQVRRFSDDVTVRYFNSTPAPRMTAKTNTVQVHHISDDVTVRYFKTPLPQEVPGSSSQLHHVSDATR